jgi:hypothetical protein
MDESVTKAVAILHAAPAPMAPAPVRIGHPAEMRPGTFPPPTIADRYRWARAARRAGMPGVLFGTDVTRAAREALAAVRGMATTRLARMLAADTVVPAPARTARARAARSLLRRSLASAALDHAPPGSRHMT